jgi:hypothetical protein
MQTDQLIKAYKNTALPRLGITFDDAINTPMFAICLSRIAESMQKPYIPLPKHAPAKPLAYKD